MNILSNILKIDYSLYIIYDKKIQQEMINYSVSNNNGNSSNNNSNNNNGKKLNNIILIKYNDIYYLHYLNIGINTGYIYLYDNINTKYKEILNYDINKKYLNYYLHIENKYEKDGEIINIQCNNLKYFYKKYDYSNRTRLSIIKYTYYINTHICYSKIYNKQHKISILNYNYNKIIKYYYYNYKYYIKYYKDKYYYNKNYYNIQNKHFFTIRYNIIIFVIYKLIILI